MHEPLAILGGILIAVLLFLGFLMVADGLRWLVARLEVRALRRRGHTVGHDEAARMLESRTHILVFDKGNRLPGRIWLVPASSRSRQSAPLGVRVWEGGLLLDCKEREATHLEAVFQEAVEVWEAGLGAS